VTVREPLDHRLADVGAFIKAQREVARMSVRRLADLAGVSNPYLSQIERGLRKPSADILQQIAKALQISAETLYVRAGLLSDEASDDNAVRDAIARDPKLTPEQRGALLNVYDSFVGAGERVRPDPSPR
jgi:transcriptional regulator with XRE-family HTH domain